MGVARIGVAPGRQRWAAILFLLGIAVLWAGALALSGANGHGAGAHAGLHHHHAALPPAPGLLALVAMWTTMMVAMMVPPELPALAGQLRQGSGRSAVARAAAFLAGLLAAWTAFATAAALVHWELARRVLADASGVLASPVAGALLLGAIGAFQLTPWKRSCLERCRTAAEPLPSGSGPGGALAAGLRHGAASLGSCALLMLLPFAAGGMGLAPMAAITALLVLEKLGAGGLLLARAAGAALLAWSAVALVGG